MQEFFTGPLADSIPTGSGRIIVAGAGAGETIMFTGGGLLSFSGQFFYRNAGISFQ